MRSSEIVKLNVGGQVFATSKTTLLSQGKSFFSILLNGDIPSLKDENGAIFIDRDPKLFQIILNYLRANDIELENVNINSLKHEAEFYGLDELAKKLSLSEDNLQNNCGDILFNCYIPCPDFSSLDILDLEQSFPSPNEISNQAPATNASQNPSSSQTNAPRNHSTTVSKSSSESLSSNYTTTNALKKIKKSFRNSIRLGIEKKGCSIKVNDDESISHIDPSSSSSMLPNNLTLNNPIQDYKAETRSSINDHFEEDFVKRRLKSEVKGNTRSVTHVICQQNWLLVCYNDVIGIYQYKEPLGWSFVHLSGLFPRSIDRVALYVGSQAIPLGSNVNNVPSNTSNGGNNPFSNPAVQQSSSSRGPHNSQTNQSSQTLSNINSTAQDGYSYFSTASNQFQSSLQPNYNNNSGTHSNNLFQQQYQTPKPGASPDCLFAVSCGSKIYLFSLTHQNINNPFNHIVQVNSQNLSANQSQKVSIKTQIGLLDARPSWKSESIGKYSLNQRAVDHLFFVGMHLVALSRKGLVGVRHVMTNSWQVWSTVAINCYDVVGTELLLLGCADGRISSINIQKFPLRIGDNDLLVTLMYRDPFGDPITSLSVYIAPCTGSISRSFWLEIAYGTYSGRICIVVQRPETLGSSPQLLQAFHVHRTEIKKVILSEKHLISVCQDYNHVRSWIVSRFRGMINTQRMSTPLASFNITSLSDDDDYLRNRGQSCHRTTENGSKDVQNAKEDSTLVRLRNSANLSTNYDEANSRNSLVLQKDEEEMRVNKSFDSLNTNQLIENLHKASIQRVDSAKELNEKPSISVNSYSNMPGPYGDREEQLIFIQKLTPLAEKIYLRLASNGKRICMINSLDNEPITAFVLHNQDSINNRMNRNSQRYLFTGHSDGSIQIWDISIALAMQKPSIISDEYLSIPALYANSCLNSNLTNNNLVNNQSVSILNHHNEGQMFNNQNLTIGGPDAREMIRQFDSYRFSNNNGS